MVPNGKPIKVPRSQAGQERRQSLRLMWTRLRRFCVSLVAPSYSTAYRDSPTANRPTATSTISMPSSSSGTPPVYRAWPEIWSMPISPMARPMNSATMPRRVLRPSTALTVVKASSIRQKYSGGPSCTAKLASIGANRVTSTVAMVPATNDPIAAVASAAPARPLLAILLPSMAVIMLPVSPGVLSRMDVVEPPYIAP